jgi:arylsulfatase A-like enzyme
MERLSRRDFVKAAAAAGVLGGISGCASGTGGKAAGGMGGAKPNIVYILADDLGYGDLGCYGQKDIRTPNLDQMAKEGMLFTQHYAGSTVCAPSRSCLMTGLHTGHTPIRGNREHKPEGQYPLPKEAATIAEVLHKAGYVTGAFGKWGLGYPGSEGDPNNQGFDEFFGYNCQRLAHNYYPYFLRYNAKKVMLPGNNGSQTEHYGPDVIQRQALEFIETNRNRRFFLYVPSTIPHAELLVPDDEIVRSYRGKFEEKPYKGVDDGPNYKLGGYGSTQTPRANFAAMVTRLDKHVGEILKKLRQLGIEKNTVVFFSSDNGPHSEGGEDPSYFNSSGGIRGQKRDLYEGGIRVPMIAYWPGRIKADSTSKHVSAFWDVFATLAEIAGAEADVQTDGISFVPALRGRDGEQQAHEYLYWEFHEQGGKQAVRKGKWKAVRLGVQKDPSAPVELYDLEADPQESKDIASEHADIVAEMMEIMRTARTDSPVFTFGQPARSADNKAAS